MLMQEKMYDFSADYRPTSVGDYSPVFVAAAVNLCRNTASPRTHLNLNPYEYHKYMPLHYNSKIFHDLDKYSQLLSSKPSLLASSTHTLPYLTMQLPIRTSSLPQNATINKFDVSTATSTLNSNPFDSLPVKRTLDGTIKSNETPETQRTQSVIMKVEDQRIVEVPTNELINRNATETDEEANICKWTNCYR